MSNSSVSTEFLLIFLECLIIRINQQISGWVECCNFDNLEDFVSEALFVAFFGRYISFRLSNFVSWLQAWFSDQFVRLLRYLWNQVCYMLRRDLVRCQSCYAIDSRIDCVNERLQFVYVALRPFVLQVFEDDVFERSKIALCKCRLRFTVCGVSVNAFAFTELFENPFELASFIRPYFQCLNFGDHAAKSFSSFLRTLSSHWLNSEFSWQYINSDKEVFNTIVVFS